MLFKSSIAAGLLAAANAAPTTTTATGSSSASTSASASASSSPFGVYSYNQEASINSAAVASVASFAGIPASEIPGADVPVFPVVSSQVNGTASHGPYSGSATTTGAVKTTALGSEIPVLPPNPVETGYVPNGLLHNPQPVPYQPAGGLGTNGTEPVYRVQSDFDYESILLGLYQEWIELDLFHNILATFNESDFTAAGLTPSDRFLIEFMADQETGHATLLSNLLGGPGGATPQCTYNYPFTTVHEAFDFTQKLTRFGESGVWGFQAHLDSREVAQLLDQSIATEARQQMIFRQFAGLFPMPVWFETGIPQSWAWTLLAPYISSCPSNSKRLAWQNFPALTVLNQPNSARINATQGFFNETAGFGPAAPSSDPPAGQNCVGNNVTGFDCSAGISQNRSIALSYPGRKVYLEWENPGKPVGPNNSYVTSTSAKAPQFVLWVSQLNATYSPLTNITTTNGTNYGMTIQPDVSTYEGDPAINGTMFIALTDSNITYTAFNLSAVNPHVAAGPFLYQAG
ncbi:Protein rds1 [Lachnellula hyalina]|uniref:Protein rds1 n=1 Tax=Lachnellula hyalina TaxID=1316788 RepID=A0A8H8TZT6_9HELO|nr:Protein rds1 [Lachnellula hyalina]TVY25346.1 Protein rds1 [Lachnellula hyalina]